MLVSRFMTVYQRNENLKKIVVILMTGLTAAVALNYFLIPANVFSAGMNGIAQIIASLLSEWVHIDVDTGTFIFLLNIPVFILGFLKVGKRATVLSFINVVCVSVMTTVLPTGQVTDNILMNALVGGVLLGVGVGISLKMGFTTGGMDIISLVLSQTTGKTVGNYMLILNGIIVVAAGFLFNWESALYTIISIYAMTQVIDAIHTSHQKVTAMIVTVKPEEVTAAISQRMVRGMTLLPSVGGYSKREGKMIMMVITRYEMYDLDQIVHEIDEDAFINILPTHSVFGRFANENEQRMYRSTGVFPEIKQTSKKVKTK
ncbi:MULTISPECIES: YitT family protein [Enterococcus]|uniref:YitT family protein n=1 Tax=Enterococcus TaxID=1350 RepID=UPI001A8E7ED8|nr:YitT family protein [Enterococcus sp. DIV1298c]MBO0490706.1 YitT family protein [Enterococcus sp. DIV1094]MBO1298722.1 YitT family protein [Enterococcus sp. DIV1271a]